VQQGNRSSAKAFYRAGKRAPFSTVFLILRSGRCCFNSKSKTSDVTDAISRDAMLLKPLSLSSC
jgi:hypothetical protein